MTRPFDLDSLYRLAFHATEVVDATQAIEDARARLAAAGHLDAFSYEAVVPATADEEWLTDRLVRPLVYFCESHGTPLPACPGVFVSLFSGRRLHFILAAELFAWAGRALGLSADDLRARYGLGEQETAQR